MCGSDKGILSRMYIRYTWYDTSHRTILCSWCRTSRMYDVHKNDMFIRGALREIEWIPAPWDAPPTIYREPTYIIRVGKIDTPGRTYYNRMYRMVPAYNVEFAAFTSFLIMACSHAACYNRFSTRAMGCTINYLPWATVHNTCRERIHIRAYVL